MVAKKRGKFPARLPDPMIFTAHGIRLDLFPWLPHYEKTAKKADEICRRVSTLRKTMDDAGLWLNEFDQKWGLLAELNIFLHDQTKQRDRLEGYWDTEKATFREGWEKGLDSLHSYFITISFLGYRDEKNLPAGKVRSMIVWLNHNESKAPLGNLEYVSKHFVF